MNRPATPPEAQQWEVSTWFASDASVRWQALQRLSLRGPAQADQSHRALHAQSRGGAVGRAAAAARARRRAGNCLELAARAVGVAVESAHRSHPERAARRPITGAIAPSAFELPLRRHLARPSALRRNGVALMRALFHPRLAHHLSGAQRNASGAAVAAGALGRAGPLRCTDPWAVEISPGIAVELATRPGPTAPHSSSLRAGPLPGMRF